MLRVGLVLSRAPGHPWVLDTDPRVLANGGCGVVFPFIGPPGPMRLPPISAPKNRHAPLSLNLILVSRSLDFKAA